MREFEEMLSGIEKMKPIMFDSIEVEKRVLLKFRLFTVGKILFYQPLEYDDRLNPDSPANFLHVTRFERIEDKMYKINMENTSFDCRMYIDSSGGSSLYDEEIYLHFMGKQKKGGRQYPAKLFCESEELAERLKYIASIMLGDFVKGYCGCKLDVKICDDVYTIYED